MRNTFYYKSSRFAIKQFAVLLVVALISSYFAHISFASTLYYNGISSTDWSDINNWWADEAFTIPADSLPSYLDDVVISGGVDLTTVDEPVVNSAVINDSGYLQISITVTNTATFNDSTSNSGGVVGNAIFNDSSSNQWNVTGTATFNGTSSNAGGTIEGVITFNDSSSNDTSLSGSPVFNSDAINSASGDITGNPVFNDSSLNEGSITSNGGLIYFNRFSTNQGSVVGDACFAEGATNNGFVTGEISVCEPLVESLSPPDGASDVLIDSNFIIDFNSMVTAETGDILLFREEGEEDTPIESIDVTSEQVTGSGTDTITINPTSNLAGGATYYIQIPGTAFDDIYGNNFAGILGETSWNFSTDGNPPLISSITPLDNAVNVSIMSNFVIEFDEEVQIGSGNITLFKLSNDADNEPIDVTSEQVTGGGTDTITINPATQLIPGETYYIQIDPTAFDDLSGNSFAGILDETSWNFIADNNNPTVSSFVPSDGQTTFGIASDLSITFNESVDVETGNIYIYKSLDDSLVETIDVVGPRVSGTGTSVITINPSADLIGSTEYYIQIDATAFDDLSGNSFAGILDETSWNFTTKAYYVWVEQTNSGQELWTSITSSSDGVKLAATVDGGYIHTSTDSGVTWTEQTLSGSRDWTDIDSSSNGTKLVATVGGGYIYTSTDSGVTWTEQTLSGSRDWTSIASSSDGVKLAATVSLGYIYTSTDSGVTWTEQTASGSFDWIGIASSSDGVKLFAVAPTGNLRYSIDSGATWSSYGTILSRGAIASSSDGVDVVFGYKDEYLYMSNNSGSTFSAINENSADWSSVTLSGDASIIAATEFNGPVYTSMDSGISFSEETGVVSGSRDWTSITSSSDGTKLAATVEDGYIYTAVLSTPQAVSVIGIPGSSSNRTVCSDNLDNDNDGLVDFPEDPGCDSLRDRDEIDTRTPISSICSDGIDNDRDGYIDFPEDSGCDSGVDTDERNSIIIPPQMFICSDGIDNDNDGLVDFPNDPGCLTVFDLTESNEVALIEEGGGSSNNGGDTSASSSGTDCNSNGSSCVVSVETCATNPSLCGEENTEEYADSNIRGENSNSLSEGQGSIAPQANKKSIIDFSDCPPDLFLLAKCLVTESFDHTGVVLGTTFKEIQAVLESETGNIITKSITTASLIFGALFTLIPLLFLNPLSFSEIFLLPMRIWSLLMTAFGIKKRNRQWGTVYDSVTKRPLDPVYVVLQDMDGKEIATSITDIDGRYGFLVKPGKYRVLPKKSDYVFPSLKMIGKTRDEIYLDLYFGYVFEVKKEGEVITKNIPMDPEGFNWNEYIKKEQKLTRFYSHRDIIFTRIADVVFSIGFTISTIALLVSGQPYNIAIFVLYVLLLVFRELGIRQKKYGQIMKKGTDIPVGYSVLRIFDVRTGVEIMHKVADQIGKYFCLIQNGTYYATIETKNIDETYTKIFTSGPIKVNHGILQENFQV